MFSSDLQLDDGAIRYIYRPELLLPIIISIHISWQIFMKDSWTIKASRTTLSPTSTKSWEWTLSQSPKTLLAKQWTKTLLVQHKRRCYQPKKVRETVPKSLYRITNRNLRLQLGDKRRPMRPKRSLISSLPHLPEDLGVEGARVS